MTLKPEDSDKQIRLALDEMVAIDAGGSYPEVTVRRSWSKHNPVISG